MKVSRSGARFHLSISGSDSPLVFPQKMPAHATPSRSFSGEGNAEAGVSPESADYVMCTHLHVDHCGWDIRLLDGRWVPMFLTRSTCSLRPNTSTGMDRRERRARV